MNNYSERVALRLSKDDKEALERVSKASGMNSSQYLRWVVRNNERGLGRKVT